MTRYSDSTDRRLRNLQWVLNSPPLVSSGEPVGVWPPQNWFEELAIPDGVTPPEPSNPHHFRLGALFEDYLAAWLAKDAKHQLLKRNLQVFDGKRTVGEFDFLVQSEAVTEHWEVAIKFYLGREDTCEPGHWLGPNTTDRFDLKYQRLVSHQLQLSKSEAGEAALRDNQLSLQGVRCFMKGRFFYPWRQWREDRYRSPPMMNPHHLKCWWISTDEFAAESVGIGSRFAYLPKQLWMAPLAPGDVALMYSASELLDFMRRPRAEQATHVAVLDVEGGEISRGFIVTEQWLSRSSPA